VFEGTPFPPVAELQVAPLLLPVDVDGPALGSVTCYELLDVLVQLAAADIGYPKLLVQVEQLLVEVPRIFNVSSIAKSSK